MWQAVKYKTADVAADGFGIVRAVPSEAEAHLLHVAARAAFWDISCSVLKQLAIFADVDVPSTAGVF